MSWLASSLKACISTTEAYIARSVWASTLLSAISIKLACHLNTRSSWSECPTPLLFVHHWQHSRRQICTLHACITEALFQPTCSASNFSIAEQSHMTLLLARPNQTSEIKVTLSWIPRQYMHDRWQATMTSPCNDSVVHRESCPYIEFSLLKVPLQSEHSDCYSAALSSHHEWL